MGVALFAVSCHGGCAQEWLSEYECWVCVCYALRRRWTEAVMDWRASWRCFTDGSSTSAAGCATLVENSGPESGDTRPYDNVNDYAASVKVYAVKR